MTELLSSARVQHHLQGQEPVGHIAEFTFPAHARVQLGAAGSVHALDVFVLPRALAARIPGCGPPAGRRSPRVVELGEPVLDIDQCWMWLPLRHDPGLIQITGSAEVTARADDEKLLDLDIRVHPDAANNDNEGNNHESDQ